MGGRDFSEGGEPYVWSVPGMDYLDLMRFCGLS
jgi:hypothetical protein